MLKFVCALLYTSITFSGTLQGQALFLHGVDGLEEVGLERLTLQKELTQEIPDERTDRYDQIIRAFYKSLPYSTEESGTLWVSLWRMQSLAGPVWINNRSSLGFRSQQSTVAFFRDQILYEYPKCDDFSYQTSFLSDLLRRAETRYLVTATEGYVALLESLIPDEDIDRRIVDVPVYRRLCHLWGEAYSAQQLVFIDRTPSSDPDADAFVLLITRLQLD